jgi:hypothetical protein
MTSPQDPSPSRLPRETEATEAPGDNRPGLFPQIETAAPRRPAFARPSVPPLRIAHVMLFTACSALHLVVQRQWLQAFLPAGAGPGDAVSIFLTAEALCAGPALATVFLWPAWRARGYPFPTHGGEWLLLIFAGFTMLETVSRMTLAAGGASREGVVEGMYFLGLVICCVLMFWLAGSPRRLPVRWRVFYLLTALAYGFALVRLVLNPWFDAPILVIPGLAILFFLVILDLRASRRFPWTHWLGVAVFLLNAVIEVTQYVWLIYLNRDAA